MEKLIRDGISFLSNEKSVNQSLLLFKKSLKLSTELYPSLPFNEFLLKSQISVALFNNGFKTLSNDYFRSASEAIIHEPCHFSTQKLFTLYQNLSFLYRNQKKIALSDSFTQKAISLLPDQPSDAQAKYLLSLISSKISDENYIEALKLCQFALSDHSFIFPDNKIIEFHTLTTFCFKGLNQPESALKELLLCVELLANNKQIRCKLLLKQIFSSLYEVYASLNQDEDAIQAIITGAEMLSEFEDQEYILKYLIEAWELNHDLVGIEKINQKLEALNEKLYGNSANALEIFSMLSKYSSLNEDYEEAVRLRHKMLNVYKMNNMQGSYFDIYSIISNFYLKFSFKHAKTYIKICDNLVKSNKPNSSERRLNMLWLKYYKLIGDTQNAIKYFNICIKTSPEGDSQQIKLINDYYDYGEFTSSKNMYKESLEAYENALKLNENTKIMKNQTEINILISIGVTKRKMNDFEGSLEYFFKSSEVKAVWKEASSNEKFFHEVMTTYLAMNEYQLALHYAYENLKVLEIEGKGVSFESGLTYSSMAYAYKKLFNRPKSTEFYLKAKEIFKSLKNSEKILRVIDSINDDEAM